MKKNWGETLDFTGFCPVFLYKLIIPKNRYYQFIQFLVVKFKSGIVRMKKTVSEIFALVRNKIRAVYIYSIAYFRGFFGYYVTYIGKGFIIVVFC